MYIQYIIPIIVVVLFIQLYFYIEKSFFNKEHSFWDKFIYTLVAILISIISVFLGSYFMRNTVYMTVKKGGKILGTVGTNMKYATDLDETYQVAGGPY